MRGKEEEIEAIGSININCFCKYPGHCNRKNHVLLAVSLGTGRVCLRAGTPKCM